MKCPCTALLILAGACHAPPPSSVASGEAGADSGGGDDSAATPADGADDGGGGDDSGTVDTADGGSDDGAGPGPDLHHLIGDDADHDGVANALDCAPFLGQSYPGAPEVCGDGVVNDCDRREAGWTEELCARPITPLLRMRGAGSNLGELAALGDLRGDGTLTLGVGVPAGVACLDAGVDEAGAPIYDCGYTGGVFFLEPATLLREVGDDIRFPSDRWGDVGQRAVSGHAHPRHFGSSLEGLGDFDGDGYDDFILGNDQSASGEVDEVWLFWGPGPTTRINEGVQLFVGDDPARCAGYDMERAGDLTGDAVDDLLISDPCADQVWVYSGVDVWAATGPALAPVGTITERATPGIHFGLGVNGTRDLTGDGLADLAASAPQPTAGLREADLDYVGVYEGPLTGERDASEAVFTMRSALSRPDGALHATGYTLDVGDLNGDGYGDLAIADPEWLSNVDPGSMSATFVFYGPLAGEVLDVDAPSIVHSFGGHDVAVHTDFDGDGRDDLLVSSGIYPREVAFRAYMGSAGEAYLMYSPFHGSTRATDDADVIFSCAEDRHDCTDFGLQVQAIPDLSGDGVPDVVVADYGNEYWIFAVPLPTR